MRASATTNRHIPAEILLRFSSVSKSWNSKIFEPSFVKRHRAAMRGRERIALVDPGSGKASSFLVPSDSLTVTVEATDLACPFSDGKYKVEASCKELWLVRACESLYLWNPSMRNHKTVAKLRGRDGDFFLGLGYESVGDDFKILRIPYPERSDLFELYSLRSDSWTSIQDFPTIFQNYNVGPCVLVVGKLHWMAVPDFSEFADDSAFVGAVISFDLSTEKFGEVGLPVYHQASLCMSVDTLVALDIWVMEECGVARSWSKKFSMQRFNRVSSLEYKPLIIQPLYFYENGDVLTKVYDLTRWRRRMLIEIRSRPNTHTR